MHAVAGYKKVREMLRNVKVTNSLKDETQLQAAIQPIPK